MRTLKEIKNTMSVAASDLVIDGRTIAMSQKFINDSIIEGVYRQLSMDTAGQDSEKVRNDILSRFERGYLKASDEKKANQVLEVKGSKGGKVPFTQTEIIFEARALTKDKKALEILDKIAVYDSEKFGLVLLSVADKPDSLISQAIKSLTERKAEKDRMEREALMSELDVI